MKQRGHVKGNGKDHAFSLIEILVVIAIIAVMVALLFPAYQKMKASAQLGKCVSNLQELYVAWTQYAADHNGRILMAYDLGGGGDWNGGIQYILPWGNNSPGNHSAYHCPASSCRTGPSWNGSSYAYNSSLGWQYPDSRIEYSISQLTQPGKLVLLSDAAQLADYVNSDPARGPQYACMPYLDYVTQDNNGRDRYKGTGYQSHNGRANFLFADGHVETLPPDVVAQRWQDHTLLLDP